MKFFAFLFSIHFAVASYAAQNEVVILDVRTPEEYQDRHLKDSLLIDFNKPNFKERVAKLDRDKSYKLYCRTGNRSGQAVDAMKSLGFTDLENLGGVEEAAKKLNQTCEPKAC